MSRSLFVTVLTVSIAALAWFVPTPSEAYVYLAPSHCPNGARWQIDDLPVDYYLNEDGSDDISDFSQLEQTIGTAFDAWESPCCSRFDSHYAGTTPYSALDDHTEREGRVVLSWRENNWPAQLGHPSKTLAFTNPRFEGCGITGGTVMFNGTVHTFGTSTAGGGYDLHDVATHEVGHLVGLGHTPDSGATMAPSYHTGMDELAVDDKEGICSLYDGGTCSCSSDAECYGSKSCVDGACRAAPCSDDTDCSGPKHCDDTTGQCVVPSCTESSDCRDDYRCNRDGKCVPECTICQSCQSRSDCGANAVCAQIDSDGHCVTQCGADGACPGNSTCFSVPDQQGNRYYLCLNPGADSGDPGDVCPATYTCSFDDGSSGDAGTADAGHGDVGLDDAGSESDTDGVETATGSCPSLGATCSANDHSRCGSDADGCMLLADGNQICTCSCTMDRDCGPGNTCVQVANGSSWCFPNESDEDDGSSDCEMSCGTGEQCRDGRCVATADRPVDRADAGSDASEPTVISLDRQHAEQGCTQPGPPESPAPLGWLAIAVGLGLLRCRSR